MPQQTQRKRKGNGAAGGGLEARMKGWDEMRMSNVSPKTKRDPSTGHHYHKPGSNKK